MQRSSGETRGRQGRCSGQGPRTSFSKAACIAIVASVAVLMLLGLGGTGALVATDEGTPTPTNTPTNTATNTATNTPTSAATNTPTNTPTETPVTSTPTVEATVTPSTTPGTATPTALVTIADAFATPIADVEALADGEFVSGGSWHGLLSKLEAAQERGNDKAAENILAAFAHQLDAFNRSGHISVDNYDLLKTDFQNLVDKLNGVALVDDSRRGRGHKWDTDEEGDDTAAIPTATPETAATATAVTALSSQADDQTDKKKDWSGRDGARGNGQGGNDAVQGNGNASQDKPGNNGKKDQPNDNSKKPSSGNGGNKPIK